MMPILGFALLTLTLSRCTEAFVAIGGGTSTHISITRTALLEIVRETCRDVVEHSGHKFEPTGPSPEELVSACLRPTATGEVSGAKFHVALQEIYSQNGLVDQNFADSAPHHFNSEAFIEGRALITQGLGVIKANVKKENFQAARETLGRVLHTLQDFYSHSNWVELGYTDTYINLIRPDLPLENMADAETATCSDCASGNCPNPILPNILAEQMLTSGYMGIFSDEKPKGKCSHGGAGDMTSTVIPRGGISKDERRADNGAFHSLAVNLAITATKQLLEDIRAAVGHNEFLRLVGIARSSVVCFVIDTTGSMGDDIAEAREVINEIIDSKKGTQDEPSEYILVPFNDPEFGPLYRTTDAEEIKKKIADIKPDGGGDIPEMSLSGLRLALTGAPKYSSIYVFTDAQAKDIHLKDTVIALMRTTKSVVSFFLTSIFGRRRRSLSIGRLQDYKDMALASGGQVIQVSKGQLPQATDIILDTSTSALVTVLQRDRNPGKEETFPFLLDESLKNVTIYITGTSIAFTLTNPAGVSQGHKQASGDLGTIQTVGNLRRICLRSDRQSGKWQININSEQPYTLKITGQSMITFIYDFVERFEGPHSSYAVISGRPLSGQPVMVMLSIIGRRGPSSLDISDVGLVIVSGPETVSKSKITDMGNGELLVTVDAVPAGEFVLSLKGTDRISNTEFQRQSTTQMSISKVNVQAAVKSNLEPGNAFTLPFSVFTTGSGGEYTINAKNDRDFIMRCPESLTVTTGERANATLIITPPPSTPSGTDVTLTLEAKASSGEDSNFVVLRFAVVTKVTDFVPPVCKVVNVASNECPQDASLCGSHNWELTANITDESGIDSVSLRQGGGNLTHTLLGAPAVQVSYTASCCSPILDFSAVDKAGNVGKCFHSIITDDLPPMCEIVSVKAFNCPKNASQCNSQHWELNANLTDGKGTGIKSISLRVGDGDLSHTSLSSPVVQAHYNASCCIQSVEFVAMDKLGHEGKCTFQHSVVPSASPPALSLSLSLWLCLLMSAVIGLL
ncbi:von Willebrand factor A domain-containing protein 7-like [Nelusetta ayraudi]|uniref:von Willebrand factor A domain-containing protein 7-like n=1 Tax=Nelusetta ayraudi TaxID=303726 RepID=UPI003F7265BD